jgi:hypothetical protein
MTMPRMQNSALRRIEMVKVFTATVPLLAAVLLVDTPGSAQQAPEQSQSPVSEHQNHVYDYDKFDLACLRWTDQCRICVRSTSGQESICSNIGIACQPAEVQCLQRTQHGGTR